MAKNKKKKQGGGMPKKTLKTSITKTQFDKNSSIARKMMKYLGFDTALFEMFSKKQKLSLLNGEAPAPAVHVEKGHFVPRQYVNHIRREVLDFMRNHYLDEETKLTYLDVATYGTMFLINLKLRDKQGLFTPEQKTTFVDELIEKSDDTVVCNEQWVGGVFRELLVQTNLYSRVTFRTYGFGCTWEICDPKEVAGLSALRLSFKLTSTECEQTYFTYQGKSRLAYRMQVGKSPMFESSPVVIKKDKVFPNAKPDEVFNIYVQSHAIHRFKERVDFLGATTRNYVINVSLTTFQRVAKDVHGYPLLACTLHEMTLGYFPFTTQGDNLYILSFLPVVSSVTPEGGKLQKVLPLGVNDFVYLGMDKLSFFLQVDFEQIPILKQAFIDSGLWQLKELLWKICKVDPDELNTKKTTMVKEFFRKLALSDRFIEQYNPVKDE